MDGFCVLYSLGIDRKGCIQLVSSNCFDPLSDLGISETIDQYQNYPIYDEYYGMLQTAKNNDIFVTYYLTNVIY